MRNVQADEHIIPSKANLPNCQTSFSKYYRTTTALGRIITNTVYLVLSVDKSMTSMMALLNYSENIIYLTISCCQLNCVTFICF